MALRVLTYNTCGLSANRRLLEDLAVKYHLDIIFAQETRSTWKINNIPGYDSIITMQENGVSNGLQTYIKKNLKYEEITKEAENGIDFHTIKVETRQGEIYLTNFYKSPAASISVEKIKSITAKKKSIILGDFNCPHTQLQSKRDSPGGATLLRLQDELRHIIHLPNQPTRGPNYLDIGISHKVRHNITLSTMPKLLSDHHPVLCEIGTVPFTIAPPITRKLKKADWDKYKKILKEWNPQEDVQTTEQLDQLVHNMQTAIKTTFDKICPTARTHIDRPRTLPIEILILKRRANQLRKQSKKAPLSAFIGNAYQQAKLEYKNKLQELQDHQWNSLLQEDELSIGQTSLWRRIEKIKRGNEFIPQLKSPDGTVSTDNLSKAEILADRYEEVHSMTENLGTAGLEEAARIRTESYLLGPNGQPGQTCEQEISRLIKKLKLRKAPGGDGIPNVAIKNLPKNIVSIMTRICNLALKLSHYPTPWKQATIKPIPKKGKDLSKPASHRPISLLPGLGKVFEKIMYKYMYKHAEKALNINQFGFRPGHSTVHALVNFSDLATLALRTGKNFGAVLLDASEAFPTMNHSLLYGKLVDLKFPPWMIKLTKSYLSERSFTVTVKEANSSKRGMRNGTPQGSVMGPLLWILYMNDIKEISSSQIIYADDTTIHSSNEEATLLLKDLQKQLDATAEHMTNDKILLNADKTNAIIISNRKKDRDPGGNLQMKIQKPKPGDPANAVIKWEATTKLLGITFDSRLTFQQHVEKLRGKAWGAMRELGRFLNKRSKLQSKTKVRIYTTYIRSILTYGSPSWAPKISATTMRRLQGIQTKILQMCLDRYYLPLEELHRLAGIPLMRDFLHSAQQKFFDSLKTAPPHLRKIRRENHEIFPKKYDIVPHKTCQHPING